ncbi:AAA family ATPase [Nigerium massiliense]|uniref:AAA family ATPase n=1 Tax=Nigerium massiliense TaxID=1522317 RepID=UPI0012FE20E6|nr:AAA family ATPase [Nigerium massiliense]
MGEAQRLADTVWKALDSSDLDEEVKYLVAAAVEGQQAFDSYLGGGALPAKPDDALTEAVEDPAGAYLTRIGVEGFRGVGPHAKLPLAPGPGLTVVTGRNGSGKSSFAEAVEIALTGRYSRAADRPAEWSRGWRNLHHDTACVDVGLVIEGGADAVATVRCTWAKEATLVEEATVVLQRGRGRAEALAALGWADALTTYRPFLSHNELGQVLVKEPKVLFDSLSAILGLGAVTDALERLAEASKALREPLMRAKTDAKELAEELTGVEDERASRVAALLRSRTWDLDAVRDIASGGARAVGSESEVRLLDRVALIQLPSPDRVDAVCSELTDALAGVLAQTLASGPDEEVAELLQRALAWQSHAGEDPVCPVCEQGVLTGSWVEDAQAKLGRLTEASNTAQGVRRRVTVAERACRDLIPPVPEWLADVPVASAQSLLDAWMGLAALPDGVSALPEHIALWMQEVRHQLDDCTAEADAELRRREGIWLPIAARLLEWVALAQVVEDDAPRRERTLAAQKWLKETEDGIRNARLRPLATQAAQIWSMLRQESNVEFAGIKLEGAKTRRRVDLDVRIDGSGSSALAVMSQGELNALALSIFLPRATVPQSPFRFLVIDDPVQAMDPSKVDGLARVLHAAAETRQVIVFTHDDRLPEALRRLQLDSTILSVARGLKSVVEVETVLTPPRRYWSDADALLRDDNVSDAVAQRVVPGVLRLALEAACQQKIRQARLSRPGCSHAAVEELLRQHKMLYPLMALALFDDASRTGDVLNRLNGWGRWAADTFRELNSAAHRGADRRLLDELRSGTRGLIKKLDQWGAE